MIMRAAPDTSQAQTENPFLDLPELTASHPCARGVTNELCEYNAAKDHYRVGAHSAEILGT